LTCYAAKSVLLKSDGVYLFDRWVCLSTARPAGRVCSQRRRHPGHADGVQ